MCESEVGLIVPEAVILLNILEEKVEGGYDFYMLFNIRFSFYGLSWWLRW